MEMFDLASTVSGAAEDGSIGYSKDVGPQLRNFVTKAKEAISFITATQNEFWSLLQENWTSKKAVENGNPLLAREKEIDAEFEKTSSEIARVALNGCNRMINANGGTPIHVETVIKANQPLAVPDLIEKAADGFIGMNNISDIIPALEAYKSGMKTGLTMIEELPTNLSVYSETAANFARRIGQIKTQMNINYNDVCKIVDEEITYAVNTLRSKADEATQKIENIISKI